jgi:hypothetical protein
MADVVAGAHGVTQAVRQQQPDAEGLDCHGYCFLARAAPRRVAVDLMPVGESTRSAVAWVPSSRRASVR